MTEHYPEKDQVALVHQGPLSGRVYAVTRWHPSTDGAVSIADEKYDITESLSVWLAARGIYGLVTRPGQQGADQ